MSLAFHKQQTQGFSLVEMAMVLMILGILLSGVLVAVGDSTTSVRITRTQNQLELLEEALYGFAQANGRLPCPATDTSDGVESFTGNGVCDVANGMIPNVTLGVYGSVNEDGMLLDAWQNPIRYTVSTATYAGQRAFTYAPALSGAFNTADPLGSLTGTLISVYPDNTCSGTPLSINAPAIIYSLGENWATFTSADETENAEGTLGASNFDVNIDTCFVDTEYNEDNFDDELRWLSPHILFSRLIKAGQLP